MQCPKCGGNKWWVLRRAKYKCAAAACRYEWLPGRLPLRLSKVEWIRILELFLKGKSGLAISSVTGLHVQRVLRALGYIRRAMLIDVTLKYIFELTLHLEKYLNSDKYIRLVADKAVIDQLKRKPPVFCFLFGEQVFALVLPYADTSSLFTIINNYVTEGWHFYSDRWAKDDEIQRFNFSHNYRPFGRGGVLSRHLYKVEFRRIMNYPHSTLKCTEGGSDF